MNRKRRAPARPRAAAASTLTTPDMGTRKKARADQPYTTTRWKGRPKYNCTNCSYDTLNQEDIEVHVKKAHAQPRAQPSIPPSGGGESGGTSNTEA